MRMRCTVISTFDRQPSAPADRELNRSRHFLREPSASRGGLVPEPADFAFDPKLRRTDQDFSRVFANTFKGSVCVSAGPRWSPGVFLGKTRIYFAAINLQRVVAAGTTGNVWQVKVDDDG